MPCLVCLNGVLSHFSQQDYQDSTSVTRSSQKFDPLQFYNNQFPKSPSNNHHLCQQTTVTNGVAVYLEVIILMIFLAHSLCPSSLLAYYNKLNYSFPSAFHFLCDCKLPVSTLSASGVLAHCSKCNIAINQPKHQQGLGACSQKEHGNSQFKSIIVLLI